MSVPNETSEKHSNGHVENEGNGSSQKSNNRWVTTLLIGLTISGALVFLLAIGLVAYIVQFEDTGDIQVDSYLKIVLDPSVQDGPREMGLAESFSVDPNKIPPLVTEISAAVRHGITDDRIQGIYLVIAQPTLGWATLQELRSALVAFTESGKSCVAYSDAYSTSTYYLASVCDHVLLSPNGLALVNGLSVSVTYYADALKHLGVTPEFEHVGDFKTAVESFERMGPSDAAKEANNDILDSLYGQVVAGIASSRGITVEAVKTQINHPALVPAEALAQGLVDGLAFEDVVRSRLHEQKEEGWRESLSEVRTSDETSHRGDITHIDEYLKAIRANQRTKSAAIAVVHADGAIMDASPEESMWNSEGLTGRTFKEWMGNVRKDSRVKAVVLRVNSPGGSALASDLIWREITRTQNAGKPVVVSMADYAASGGYWISAPADWIVAQPGTLTGSIGVFGGKLNIGGTFDSLGIAQHHFTRGDFATLFSGTDAFSDEGREIFREYLHSTYDQFLTKVGDGRDMSRDEVEAVAKGRVWTGERALELGLVDALGGLDIALAKAAELAELDSYGLVRQPEHKGLMELLLDDFSKSATALTMDAIHPSLDADLEEFKLISTILSKGGVAAYLPGRVQVE